MTFQRYVVAPANGAFSLTLPAGAFTENLYAAAGTAVNGTGSYAQGANTYGSVAAPGVMFTRGQVVWADSAGTGGAGALYTAIGAGNLRAWVDGQDTQGHSALSN
jgi:hypothetical protein